MNSDTDRPATALSRATAEAIRFTMVSGLGVFVDLLVEFIARHGFKLNLHLCAALGIAIASLFNFELHRHWTFQRRKEAGASSAQLITYLFSSLITFLIRSAVLFTLPIVPLPGSLRTGFPALVVATGTSFAINFLLCRSWVFKRPPNLSRESLSS